MDSNAITFAFPDRRSAYDAYDTLQELGYRPVFHEANEEGQPVVHIHLDRNDLTAALEIAQSHGGQLLENPAGNTEMSVYNSAYDMDALLIPAHTVNEDWPEGYADGGGAGRHAEAAESLDDPGADTFDHFEAGIRL